MGLKVQPSLDDLAAVRFPAQRRAPTTIAELNRNLERFWAARTVEFESIVRNSPGELTDALDAIENSIRKFGFRPTPSLVWHVLQTTGDGEKRRIHIRLLKATKLAPAKLMLSNLHAEWRTDPALFRSTTEFLIFVTKLISKATNLHISKASARTWLIDLKLFSPKAARPMSG